MGTEQAVKSVLAVGAHPDDIEIYVVGRWLSMLNRASKYLWLSRRMAPPDTW